MLFDYLSPEARLLNVAGMIMLCHALALSSESRLLRTLLSIGVTLAAIGFGFLCGRYYL